MASKSLHGALAATVIAAGVAAAVIGVAVGVRSLLSTPRPGAALIKRVFERNAETVRSAMLPHVPEGVSAVLDRPYGPAGAANTLDVYFPTAVSGTDARLPTVFWIHGGAWISGDKREIAPYLQILAAEGFTVVGINYPLSPDAPYPAALHDAAAALRYLTTHAARLHIDTDRIVIAGDSAGAQLGAQLSTLITSPPYAGSLGVVAPLDPEGLRGVVLCCGLFNLPSMVGGHGLLGWGFTQALWAYRGLPPAPDDPVLAEMSAARHVTSAFPPAFITGGNADPLTATQSRVLASRLTELDVPVETVFFAEDRVPALGHEYQFALDTADGRETLAAIVGFLRERTGR